ncbi:hypothetical protein VNO77_17263 [Canavalia gladiata]|uniref:Uncharacterized protein n=1 Tax=Canavalia gladiata TaxID=3824 RepID=A0AAN9LIN0_CANGL
MGNRNSSNSKVHGQASKVASTEPGYGLRIGKPVSAFRDEVLGKSKAGTSRTSKGQRGIGVYSEPQCTTPLDNDDTFNDFIRRAKKNIRTVSHIGREQSHVAAAPPPDEASSVSNSKENQNDQFSSFIQRARKRLRTTSSIRKNGSFKSG